MNIKTLGGLVCACALLCSCQMSQDTGDAVQFAGFDAEPMANGDGLPVASFEVIPLETDTDCVIANVKKIIELDSLYVIVSDQKVMAFDRHGKFLHDIGARGRGAGEYLMVNTAYWDKWSKTLDVVDGVRGKIFAYDLSGKLVKSSDLDQKFASSIHTAELLDANRLFCANYLYNDKNEVFTVLNLKKQSQKTLFSFPGKTDNTQEYTGRHPFSLYDGAVSSVVPYSNTAYAYDVEEGGFAPSLVIETNQKMLGEKDQAKISDFSIMRYADQLNNDIFVGFTDIFETDRYVLLAFYNMYYVLIEKGSDQLKRYDYTVSSEGISRLPLFGILATGADDTLVGYVDAFRLKSWKFQDGNADSALERLRSAAATTNISDNGCLLVYHLK